jgi:hypothetical protein
LPRGGDQIVCEWRLVNNGDSAVVASFYVRTTPARLAALSCSSGRVLRGHYHGSAVLQIGGGEVATVAATLGPLNERETRLRVAVVTKSETFARNDIITVELD